MSGGLTLDRYATHIVKRSPALAETVYLSGDLKYTPCIFLVLFLIFLLYYANKKMKGFKNKD